MESLVHAFLSFAPVAAGAEDSQTERTIQLIQSVSDLVTLRRDKFVTSTSTTRPDGIRFVLRVMKCFQLWCEMRSSNSGQFSMRLEMTKLSLSMLLLRSNGGRLPDTEIFEQPGAVEEVYVGSRTGTRLKALSSLFQPVRGETQFSDFLHAIVPIVYLTSSKDGWTRASWTSWMLAVGLEWASIVALPEEKREEKSLRLKKLVVESLIRQPMFNAALAKPVSGISSLWNKIPLLCDFNYLEYYVGMHRKYFYFHQ